MLANRMKNQREKAEEFLSLHDRKRTFVLPNAWDVPSARVFEDAGFRAVATSSAGMMVSLGYPDGELIDRKALVGAVARIARVLSVPLSADVVSGFGKSVGQVLDTVRKIMNVGAVGINIEDVDHSLKQLFPMQKQAGKINSLLRLREELRVPFVINARTDALRFYQGTEEERLEEAIRRSVAYRDAGAHCVYPMGLVESAAISKFVEAVDCPVNVMIRKGLPPLEDLKRLGVARVSFGPAASYAVMGFLKRISHEVLERGMFDSLVNGAISFDELNKLALPRSLRDLSV